MQEFIPLGVSLTNKEWIVKKQDRKGNLTWVSRGGQNEIKASGQARS